MNATEPAFPVRLETGLGEVTFPGITIRDYFAAMAMQALIQQVRPDEVGIIASTSYIVADQMIEEANK